MKYSLICFDLDGTLVDGTIYIWKTLHESFKTDPQARKQAHDDFFAGRISYADWFHHDLKLLRAAGATRAGIMDLLTTLHTMKGANQLLRLLKERGHFVALISGSLDVVCDKLFPDNPFDYQLINKIHFDAKGHINGGEPTKFDLEAKADGLRHICSELNIGLERAVFIGDNVNDVEIARVAGHSIAFNCKSDQLREVADIEITQKDLMAIVPIIS